MPAAWKEGRGLRVYCPAHRVSFEGAGGGRVVCEAGAHALAERFPHTEVWEHCCDCRNCWPSSLGRGSAAADQRPVCARPEWLLYDNLGPSFYYAKDYAQAVAYYRKAAERAH